MTTDQGMISFGAGFDFTDPDLRLRGLPLQEFATLRRTAPVWWNEQDPDKAGGFRDGGYWVISKHRHIREISRDPQLWSSNINGCVMRYVNDVSPEEIEAAKALMHNSDPPVHTRLRKLISRMFTPRNVAALKEGLTAAAHRIVSAAAQSGEGDFVKDVAYRLPMKAIADLVGFPEEDRDKVFHWANAMMLAEDPEQGEDARAALVELMGYSYVLAEQRRKNPADDIITRLVTAGEDGDQLSELEFGYFIVLLATAGNETTANATALGMEALLRHPEQWELYKRTRAVTAADEIIRWSSPVNVFQRTATRDTEIAGVTIRRGERVGLFYGSANYDEEVFEDPFTLNIERNPNPHLGFGGTGPHYCIGANLARMELDIILNAIADHIPDLCMIDEPTRARAALTNGLSRMPVRYNAS
ncbi:cytochrome P450 [Mycobacterium terramassiliense]|uniref:Cytochrome P450 n=1 Tax=Mycobacterium terramassiliense TaxID=1841859 RepID=A0A2U3NGK8_9MYCO|nr:cytochrome P450 [Mycobacterium terramassiliense]SPM30564.1 Cytochrome P450 [Mycobacterium terramassiliense]